jgi:hypothetical protein
MDAISAEDELDLASEGMQPTEADWTVVSAEVEDTDNGRRAVVAFVGQVGSIEEFKVTERYWLAHNNPDAARVGKGNLKRLFIAVFGTPKATIASLAGKRVHGTVREDDSGFRRLGRFKAVEAGSTAPTVTDLP